MLLLNHFFIYNLGISKRQYDAAVCANKEIDWTCSTCRPKSLFNFTAALHRILAPTSRPRKRVLPLIPLIHAEQMRIAYLSMDELQQPLFVHGHDFPVCLYSQYLLRRFFPDLSTFSTLSTTADGNCLFNAVSILVGGNERLAPELRLRSLIELTNNKEFYLNKHNMFSNTADYDEAVLDCARIGSYSCVWTLCALSTVLKRDIISLYPAINGEEDAAVGILTCDLHPRTREYVDSEPIRILWTRTQPVASGMFWTPNHFVPLTPRALTSELHVELHPTSESTMECKSHSDVMPSEDSPLVQDSEVIPSEDYPQAVSPSEETPQVPNYDVTPSEDCSPPVPNSDVVPSQDTLPVPSEDCPTVPNCELPEPPMIVEAHKGGKRLLFNGFCYVKNKLNAKKTKM